MEQMNNVQEHELELEKRRTRRLIALIAGVIAAILLWGRMHPRSARYAFAALGGAGVLLAALFLHDASPYLFSFSSPATGSNVESDEPAASLPIENDSKRPILVLNGKPGDQGPAGETGETGPEGEQ